MTLGIWAIFGVTIDHCDRAMCQKSPISVGYKYRVPNSLLPPAKSILKFSIVPYRTVDHRMALKALFRLS